MLNQSDRNQETTGPNRREVINGAVALTLAGMAGEAAARPKFRRNQPSSGIDHPQGRRISRIQNSRLPAHWSYRPEYESSV